MSAAPINDGGSAFPLYDHHGNGQQFLAGCGMSLRDYFAAESLKAIATMVAQGMHTAQQIGMSSPEASIARDAYRLADAMLSERAKATGGAE